MDNKDTIVAISTPPGEGGIGIVRLSGPDAFAVAEKIFLPGKNKKLSACPSHTMHHGYIKRPDTLEAVDEVLVSVMKAPATYTTEDTVEINCHGGGLVLKKVLELCVEHGARPAEPGEFTKRAFLTGRIDLAQAEAVFDVIKASSEAARRMAQRQLEGALSAEIKKIRGKAIDILSNIELSLDFGEEDVDFAKKEKLIRDIVVLRQMVADILASAAKAAVLKNGAKAVICGKPNVGKSSLMNALLGKDRVIVNPVSGTTRDVVEDVIGISGVTVRLFDTAGISEAPGDEIAKESVRRSREIVCDADVVIFVLDLSVPLSEEDRKIFKSIKDKKVVIAANKSDLKKRFSVPDARKLFSPFKVVEISALSGMNLGRLEEAVFGEIFKGDGRTEESSVLVSNARHVEALKRALEGIDRAAASSREGLSAELIANDLNETVRRLDEITGETASEEVLDRIFGQFCIGK